MSYSLSIAATTQQSTQGEINANAAAKEQVRQYFASPMEHYRANGEAICAVIDALPPCSSISGSAFGSIPQSPNGSGSISIALSFVRAPAP